jgi:hypothetical protein
MMRDRKSIVFQARLNPAYQHEQKAIAILRELEGQGMNRRDILTDALVSLADSKGVDVMSNAVLDDSTVDTLVQRIIAAIRPLFEGVAVHNGYDMTDDSDRAYVDEQVTTFAQNYANGVMRRKGRK